MGAFSSFHFLIILVVFIVIFGVPITAILRENSDKIIKRRDFLYWAVGYLSVPFFISYIGEFLNIGDITDAVSLLFILVGSYPFYQRIVRRARDVGMSKRIAFVSMIPIVFFVCIAILVIKPSKEVLYEEVFD
ncbi:hypothetical protein WH96_02895 [Kiloniella spongiae]|uniref:Uncharacterized protein n=1 Tax=Kiloniella spongiae TaxID=1489064 RepID=A0A0H2MJA2_9PROT|nr:DUF805 domain-containing protein [Kiloniella spongiae]KLN62463.1 hypothetical protein WH96_02895 [Kiloniella spongiae]